MIKKIKVQEGHNIIDIAIQYYGGIEGLLQLSLDNSFAVDTTLTTGQELLIDDEKIVNKKITEYLKAYTVVSGAAFLPDSDFLIVDENGEPIVDELGEPILYQ